MRRRKRSKKKVRNSRRKNVLIADAGKSSSLTFSDENSKDAQPATTKRVKPQKHNINTLTEVLKKRTQDKFIKVISVNNDSSEVVLEDSSYGNYKVDLKSFCPNGKTPLHRERTKKLELEDAKIKYEGKIIKGYEVKEIKRAQAEGYKNRGFIAEALAPCGHTIHTTISHLKNHRNSLKCSQCAKTQHGERTKTNGVRKKRTRIYTRWVEIKEQLNPKYDDFIVFKTKLGEQPNSRAKIKIYSGEPVWETDVLNNEDEDLELISKAIRSVFRRSKIYKGAIEKTKIETENGTRYKCEKCFNLFKRSEIQVDHINPVKPLDGSKLKKETLIDSIWTENVQVLDQKCHKAKSKLENAQRRENKKTKKENETR